MPSTKGGCRGYISLGDFCFAFGLLSSLSDLCGREECKAQVEGFFGAKYKKFRTGDEASAFVSGSPIPTTATGDNEIAPDESAAPVDISKALDDSGWDVVYCDGACKGNGQPGSVAGIGVWWGENDPRYAIFIYLPF